MDWEQPEATAQYEALRLIGQGAYGAVYLARAPDGGYCALKVISRESFEENRPFEREYEGLRKFQVVSNSYDSQVRIRFVGRREEPQQFFYAMELADDQDSGRNINPDTYVPKTLRSELKRRGRLALKECLSTGIVLAKALEHLHENGLIHRDIKPANIIFVDSRPKLADIGLVTDLDFSASHVGTEGFVPPEGASSPQADIYSLGKVLYEMSTGHGRLDFPELPTDLHDLPDRELLLELNAVMAKACAHDPRQRYQSARQMADDLLFLQRGGSVRRKRAARRKLVMVAWVGSALAMIAFLGLAAHRFGKTPPPGRHADQTSVAPGNPTNGKTTKAPGGDAGQDNPARMNEPHHDVRLKFVSVDSEEIYAEHGDGENAVDGNRDTYWHTEWHDHSPPLPHEIVVELIPPSTIKGFTYLPRQDESDHGTIRDYEFYVSDDGKNFGQPVKKGSFKPSKEEKIETCKPIKCRFIKLRAISEIHGLPWAAAAEIGVIQSNENASGKDSH